MQCRGLGALPAGFGTRPFVLGDAHRVTARNALCPPLRRAHRRSNCRERSRHQAVRAPPRAGRLASAGWLGEAQVLGLDHVLTVGAADNVGPRSTSSDRSGARLCRATIRELAERHGIPADVTGAARGTDGPLGPV